MSFKNETLAEAYESLEEAISDLVYFKASPAEIRYAVERDMAWAVERMNDWIIERMSHER